ncbi:MAG TPA: hypothetical protein DCK76_01730 [Desulfotomaculum sp.]|nr:MAG: hypothetical protein XD78_1898 [Desulfotomaculum sp. 46_296]HAG10121.1 hypothetical protein [Desulfotomaculum sp.]HBY03777.1 hypothetical protein [Desulfotomaculum sp.]
MINKIFHIPNLKISCLKADNLSTKKFFWVIPEVLRKEFPTAHTGLTCFIARDSKTTYLPFEDGFCKDIIGRVFEIGEILKKAGRFEEKSLDDRYMLRTFECKKLFFSDEDYFLWANIAQEYQDLLTQYVENFIYDFGFLSIWPEIDKVFLAASPGTSGFSKDCWEVYEKQEDGGILEVGTDWWYIYKENLYKVEPLIFVLEYISRLYMYHTYKVQPYTFDIDINCKVAYLGDGHGIVFEGEGLHLLIDLAYSHTVTDSNKEFRQCEEEQCGTWFFADRLKKQRFCSSKCKSKHNTRKIRNKELKEKLLQQFKTINESWLSDQIDTLFEKGITGEKQVENRITILINEK